MSFTFLALTAALVATTNSRLVEAPGAPAVRNQPVSTGLATYVAGDVRVRDTAGRTLDGAIASLHDGQLDLLTRDGLRALPLESVVRIERRGDSLKNGFAIGAIVGGVLAFASCAECGDIGFRVFATAMSAPLYGLMGAGIDALYDGWTPLYVREDRSARRIDKPAAMISMRVRF
jgi:hypothetical protein